MDRSRRGRSLFFSSLTSVQNLLILLLMLLYTGINVSITVEALGVNWGTQAIHQLPPKTVVQMLKDNGINKVKLFDADQNTLSAVAGTDIEVMVAIPNGEMAAMLDYSRAKDWVQRNVTRYIFNGGVNIKYVAVSNEPFLTTYNGTYVNLTFPALQNIQKALNEAGVGDSIKATVPLNADVYGGTVPSSGQFRSDISDLMSQIAKFLAQNSAPFVVNIYPFLSLYGHPDFPIDYAFFDNPSTSPSAVHDTAANIVYTNVFDANFDTLVSSLTAVGLPNLPIVVGEVGWPTDGDLNANVAYAERFYKGLLPRLANGVGTPRRNGPIEMYLFGLLDEDAKSVAPGNFERHWGVFRYDGQPKFPMDLTGKNQENVYLVGAKWVEYLPKQWCVLSPDANVGGAAAEKVAKNVDYACSRADCTPLGYGCSCAGLEMNGNVSFAFNAYYQTQNQDELACDFEGLAVVTKQNVSQGNCNFTIQVSTTRVGSGAVRIGGGVEMMGFVRWVVVVLLGWVLV